MDPRTYVVPDTEHGKRLDLLLESWKPGIRRAALRRLVTDGLVRVNGRTQERIRRLKRGDLVTVDPSVDFEALPRFTARAAGDPSGRPPVLYEDEACLAIDKPAGLPAVPDRHGERSVHGLLDEWFGDQDLRIVHRLDKDTTGVLLLAKGIEAARALERQFREREVDKCYLALVRGAPARDGFECEAKIGKTIKGGVVRIGDHKGARDCMTRFRVLERFRGFALLEARPETGRMHQIRAHLMWIRLPLAVDPQYGRHRSLSLSEFKLGYRRKREEKPLIGRTTLHALRLGFTSPATGTRVEVEAPLAADIAYVLGKLRRYASLEPSRYEPGDLIEDPDREPARPDAEVRRQVPAWPDEPQDEPHGGRAAGEAGAGDEGRLRGILARLGTKQGQGREAAGGEES